MGSKTIKETSKAMRTVLRVSSPTRMSLLHKVDTSSFLVSGGMDQAQMPREFTRTSCNVFMQISWSITLATLHKRQTLSNRGEKIGNGNCALILGGGVTTQGLRVCLFFIGKKLHE